MGRPDGRLVTLTGPGGVGKTRLALAVGDRVRDRFDAGAAFVPLAAVTEPEQVLAGDRPGGGGRAGRDGLAAGGPGRALGRRPLAAHPGQPGAGGRRRPRPRRAAGPLLRAWRSWRPAGRCWGSRAEREYPVPPLPLPPDPGTVSARGADVLAGGGAVRRPRPRGAPRLRPHRGQRRGGGRDLPAAGGSAAGDRAGRRPHPAARPRRAAVAGWRRRWTLWGPARSTCPSGSTPCGPRSSGAWACWTTPSGRCWRPWPSSWTAGPSRRRPQVAGLDEDRALDLSEALARHSLISPRRRPSTAPGRGCWRPSAQFVAERLAARPDVAEIERRHAELLPGAGRAGGPAAAERRPERVAASGWRPRRATWPPPCAGTWPTTPGRCPTCSGSFGPSGAVGLLGLRRDHGRGPLLGRPAPAHRRLPRPPGPSRTAVDGAR